MKHLRLTSIFLQRANPPMVGWLPQMGLSLLRQLPPPQRVRWCCCRLQRWPPTTSQAMSSWNGLPSAATATCSGTVKPQHICCSYFVLVHLVRGGLWKSQASSNVHFLNLPKQFTVARAMSLNSTPPTHYVSPLLRHYVTSPPWQVHKATRFFLLHFLPISTTAQCQ